MGIGVIRAGGAAWLAALAMTGGSAAAQIHTVDPSAQHSAADDDLAPPPGQQPDDGGVPNAASSPPPVAQAQYSPPPPAAHPPSGDDTYAHDDVIDAAEGVFGKGAEGLAKLIERILKDQGQPNAYIAGGEGSGAFVVGLRYGSGLLHHKVEGTRKVYWTGPSLGFDFGGNAAKSFVLVYNLYDGEDLFKRYPAAEGVLYAIGGFTASYLRRGDVVLIPIRLGVGWHFGANIGYMKFSKKQNWQPF